MSYEQRLSNLGINPDLPETEIKELVRMRYDNALAEEAPALKEYTARIAAETPADSARRLEHWINAPAG